MNQSTFPVALFFLCLPNLAFAQAALEDAQRLLGVASAPRDRIERLSAINELDLLKENVMVFRFLSEVVERGDVRQARVAAKLLSYTNSRGVSALLVGVRRSDEELRVECLASIATCGTQSKAALSVIAQVAGGSGNGISIRRAAIGAIQMLAKHWPEWANRSLLDLLGSKMRPPVAARLLRAGKRVGTTGPKWSVFVRRRLHCESGKTRVAAAEAFAALNPPAGVSVLKAAIDSEKDVEVKECLIPLVGELRSDPVASAMFLLGVAKEGKVDAALEGMRRLLRVDLWPPSETVRVLKTGNERQQYFLVDAWGRSPNPTTAVELCVRDLAHNSPYLEVRKAAKRAISRTRLPE